MPSPSASPWSSALRPSPRFGSFVAALVLVQDPALAGRRLRPVGAADHRQTVRELLAPRAVLVLQEDLLAALHPAEGADDTTEPARSKVRTMPPVSMNRPLESRGCSDGFHFRPSLSTVTVPPTTECSPAPLSLLNSDFPS
jgi:hypothetical protein